MNKGSRRGAAAHILVVLSVLLSLGLLSAPVSKVGADDSAEYTAAEIEDWLVSQLESTTASVDSGPTVTLDLGEAASDDQYMQIDVGFAGRGITLALNHVRFTFDGTKSVSVAGELSVFGKQPRFWCDGELECAASGGIPQLSSLSNVRIADFYPSLSAGDLDTIADTINKAIEASGLQVASLEGDLTGIDVVDDGGTLKLELSWSGGSVKWDATAIQDKLDDAATSLIGEGNSYLSDGHDDERWSIDVSIDSPTGPLTFAAQFELLGITVAIQDMDITFDGDLTASFTDAVISVGVATMQTTFSGAADISCSAYIPGLTVTTLSVGDDYPAFQDWIADSGVNSGIRDALGDLIDDLVSDTGLTCRLATFDHIDVVDSKLKIWKEAGIDISGVTTEVTCVILPGVTLELYQDTNLLYSDVSLGDGSYTVTAPEAGTYTVTASKTGFRNRTQTVQVVADPVTLNFRANTGLLPKGAEMSYVLTCVNHWLYPVSPCGLEMSSVLAAVNAWLYPLP